jgi:hypothetical protein
VFLLVCCTLDPGPAADITGGSAGLSKGASTLESGSAADSDCDSADLIQGPSWQEAGRPGRLALVGALAKALGHARVPHLSALYEEWKERGSVCLETISQDLVAVNDHVHYYDHLVKVCTGLIGLIKDVVRRAKSPQVEGQQEEEQ